MDFIKGELLEIIEWTDDSRDTLSWRFPDEDKAIKNGAQLIVRESQVAQFVYVGEFGDTFKPGKHTRTMPKSLSRSITGLDVPHLLPVNSRVTTK
jgi:membrane protease subunit (stomatin/prohibitin family)